MATASKLNGVVVSLIHSSRIRCHPRYCLRCWRTTYTCPCTSRVSLRRFLTIVAFLAAAKQEQTSKTTLPSSAILAKHTNLIIIILNMHFITAQFLHARLRNVNATHFQTVLYRTELNRASMLACEHNVSLMYHRTQLPWK